QAGRDDHGVDHVDHTVRRQDVGGGDGGAVVEGQFSVLQRERDLLTLEGLDGAVLLCDCDRLRTLDVAGDDVVGEHLREQRGGGEDRRLGSRRRLGKLRERLVGGGEDGEWAGRRDRLDEAGLLNERYERRELRVAGSDLDDRLRRRGRLRQR